MPHEGEKAPDFELPTASGEKLRLSGFKGKVVNRSEEAAPPTPTPP